MNLHKPKDDELSYDGDARAGEVPAHLALIAALIAGVHDLGGDYRHVMSKVDTRKHLSVELVS